MSTEQELHAACFEFISDLARDLSRDDLDLPGFPATVVELHRTFGGASSSVQDVVALINTEPALAARLIKLASEFGRRDAEEIFLAALLQDIGMLAIDKIAPEIYRETPPFTMPHRELTDIESARLDTDHRAIEQIGKDAHRHLGILPNRLAEMFETISRQMPVTESLFEMEVFDPAQLHEISDTAREILTIRNLHALQDQADLRRRTQRLENEELKDESNRDALTGVHNRRSFEARLVKEFTMSTSQHWPLSLIFIDIDHFKQVNDSHGHQTGDTMLQEVGTLLAYNIREQDLVARFGGDEFVLLPGGAMHRKPKPLPHGLSKPRMTRPYATATAIS
ncbi:MAG: GGDEF domain-containing protein [Gammaproteobacteria bacterium]|nr:MAG: GGDEF domain-containing protein [Gammaproteobacteria bacterium]